MTARAPRRNGPHLAPQTRLQIAFEYARGAKCAAIAAAHNCSDTWVPALARKLGCAPRRPDISARLAAYHQRRREAV